MLMIVLLYLAYNYRKVNKLLRKEAESFKTSFMIKNLFTSVLKSESKTPVFSTRQGENTRPQSIDISGLA